MTRDSSGCGARSSVRPLKKAYAIDRQVEQVATARAAADMVGQQAGVVPVELLADQARRSGLAALANADIGQPLPAAGRRADRTVGLDVKRHPELVEGIVHVVVTRKARAVRTLGNAQPLTPPEKPLLAGLG